MLHHLHIFLQPGKHVTCDNYHVTGDKYLPKETVLITRAFLDQQNTIAWNITLTARHVGQLE